MGLLQNVVFGLVVGSYIAIAAIGFTLIYGIIGMINFAYGEYITAGAFAGFLTASGLGLPLPATLVVAVVLTAVFSLVLARVFFTPLSDTGPVPLLLTSIGVGLILRNGYRLAAGRTARFIDRNPGTYRFDFPDLSVGATNLLGDFFVTSQQAIVVGTALAVFVGVHLLLTRTTAGIAMRALGDDEALARVRGIDTRRVRDAVWLIAGALAGIAGVLLAVQTNASAGIGFSQLLPIIAAAILGGAGSAYGAIVGAYVIGLVMELSVALLPSSATTLGTTMAFVVLILVLLLRPSGIAGQEVRKA